MWYEAGGYEPRAGLISGTEFTNQFVKTRRNVRHMAHFVFLNETRPLQKAAAGLRRHGRNE